MSANLSSEKDNSDKIQLFLQECRNMNIKIIPPDVNRSFVHFSPGEDRSIIYGLNAIKKVGEKAAENIVVERRENGPFTSLFEFCARVELRSLNKGVLEALVASGAMDSLPGERWDKFLSIEDAIHHGQRVQNLRNTNQEDLFGGDGGQATMREPQLVDAPEWPNMDLLNREREAIGFYLTGHPLEGFEDQVRTFSTVDLMDLSSLRDDQEARAAGIISSMKIHYDKRGNQMAFFTLNGLAGELEALAFADPFGRFKPFIQNDSLVFVEGRISKRSDEDIKILVNRVIPMEEAQNEYAREIHLKLELEEVGVGQLEELLSRSRRYAGSCTLILHMLAVDGSICRVVCHKQNVSASRTFLQTLRDEFGAESVWIK